MKVVIMSRPAKNLIWILCAISVSIGGMYFAADADAVEVVRSRDLDPNPVVSPTVGNESKIYYSIPEDAKEVLTPGTLVSAKLSGCSTKHTSELTYYDCSGLYLKPYYKGNKLVYMVIERP